MTFKSKLGFGVKFNLGEAHVRLFCILFKSVIIIFFFSEGNCRIIYVRDLDKSDGSQANLKKKKKSLHALGTPVNM